MYSLPPLLPLAWWTPFGTSAITQLQVSLLSCLSETPGFNIASAEPSTPKEQAPESSTYR